jgi:transcriptional regulator with XRE-family HTH domain
MSIGLIIRSLRIEKKWTQEELAEKVGVKRQQIQAYEKEKNYPHYNTMMLLCEIFGVDMNKLAGFASKNVHFGENTIAFQQLKEENAALKKENNDLLRDYRRVSNKNEELNDKLNTLYEQMDKEKEESQRKIKKP